MPEPEMRSFQLRRDAIDEEGVPFTTDEGMPGERTWVMYPTAVNPLVAAAAIESDATLGALRTFWDLLFTDPLAEEPEVDDDPDADADEGDLVVTPDPSQADEWWSYITSAGVDIFGEDGLALIEWQVELVTGVPTRRPASSSGGPRRRSSGSTGRSRASKSTSKRSGRARPAGS